jgi:hypothetical protein
MLLPFRAMSGARRWVVPMRGREPDEAHRASTPLELFFDLVIVVAIAVAASSLHHAIADDHVALSPVAILLVLLTPLAPQPILLTGAIVVGLLVAKIVTPPQAGPPPA